MRALLPITLALLSSSVALAGPQCRDVFSSRGQVLAELSGLRLEIDSHQKAGRKDLARLIFKSYQARVSEALAIGFSRSEIASVFGKLEQAKSELVLEERRLNKIKRDEQRLFWTEAQAFSNLVNPDALVAFDSTGGSMPFLAEATRVIVRPLDGSPARDFKLEFPVRVSSVSANDLITVLGTSGSEPTGAVYDLRSGSKVSGFPIQDWRTAILRMSRDGRHAAVAEGSTIMVYESASGHLLRSLETGSWGATKLEISADGTKVFALFKDGLRAWDLISGVALENIPLEAPSAMALINGTSLVVVANYYGQRLEIRDLAKGGAIVQSEFYHPQAFPISHLVVSADGSFLAAAGNRTIDLWDVKSGRQVLQRSVTDVITSLAFAPNGQRLGVSQRTIRMKANVVFYESALASRP